MSAYRYFSSSYRPHNRYKRRRAPYQRFNGKTLVRLGLIELLRKFH